MLRLKLFLVLLCLLVPNTILAWEGKVIAVVDGDLLAASHDGREEKLRLFGVDTPDDPQDFGKEAREFTSRLVLGKTVEVVPVTLDSHGNTVAVISVGGTTLNRELVGAGLAWVYRGNCTRPECREWKETEIEARQKGTGLWLAANPIPPWEFRRSGNSFPPTGQGEMTGRPGMSTETGTTTVYRGDIVSHLYHAPGCPQYKCKGCIVEFNDKRKAENAGYKPCPTCNP